MNQRRAEAEAPEVRPDGHRELGREVVDISESLLVASEEPEPRGADGLVPAPGRQSEVSGTAPAGDIPGDLGQVENGALIGGLALGDKERLVQHFPEEAESVRADFLEFDPHGNKVAGPRGSVKKPDTPQVLDTRRRGG